MFEEEKIIPPIPIQEIKPEKRMFLSSGIKILDESFKGLFPQPGFIEVMSESKRLPEAFARYVAVYTAIHRDISVNIYWPQWSIHDVYKKLEDTWAAVKTDGALVTFE